jgi:hypothetical protein
VAETVYWRKGSSELNFGDYLTDYLTDHLFLETARRNVEIRLIGSVLDRSFVPKRETPPGAGNPPRLIAWGCGVRSLEGLTDAEKDSVEILAVRGPISAAVLGLDAGIAVGDPAFLLPALHLSLFHEATSGKSVCVPHFHDRRSDAELLLQSGCDIVLRTNIPPGKQNIEGFINAIASSRFVLSASLHGAMVAAAYRRPFAFWHSGAVDLPIKWFDFAASIGISADFVRDIGGGEKEYRFMASHIKIPSLWKSLASSPYPLRPEAVLKVLRYELGPIDDEGLREKMASRIEIFEAQRSHFSELAAEGQAELHSALAALRERTDRLDSLTQELKLHQKEDAGFRKDLVYFTTKLVRGWFRPLRRLARQSWNWIAGTSSATAPDDLSTPASGNSDLHRLFDAEWYLDANPDVHEAGFNPFEHYLQFGAHEGRNPHPMFDAGWYQRENPDVRESGDNPLLHYLRTGDAKGRSPHPLFNAGWYQRENPELQKEGTNTLLHFLNSRTSDRGPYHPLFNAEWYLRQNPDVRESGINPLLHFLKIGGDEGRAPHPLFDTQWYLRQNPDVRESGINPLLHFLEFGSSEGRASHPLFDTQWYLRQNPDVRNSGVNPLLHYLLKGAAERRDPHPLFDTQWYLRQNPSADRPDVNPLLNYLESGVAERGDAHPLFDGRFYRETYLDGIEDRDPLLDYLTSGAACGLDPNPVFHARGYACEHPDVFQFKGNALNHYVQVGRKAGFQPHPLFESDWYQSRYDDVARSGIDPYQHYVRQGHREGRRGSPVDESDSSRSGYPLSFQSKDSQPEVMLILHAGKSFFQLHRSLVSIQSFAGRGIRCLFGVFADGPDYSLGRVLKESFNLELMEWNKEMNSSFHNSEFLVFVPPDFLATRNWLVPLVETARQDSRIGIVTGGLTSSQVRESGAMLIRRTVYSALAGFESRFNSRLYPHTDLVGAVARMNYRIVHLPMSAFSGGLHFLSGISTHCEEEAGSRIP